MNVANMVLFMSGLAVISGARRLDLGLPSPV